MERTVEELLETLQATQAREALILDLMRSQRGASDPDEILRITAQTVAEHLGVERVEFFEVRNDQVCFLAGWATSRLLQLTGSVLVTQIRPEYVTEFEAGHEVRVADLRTDLRTTSEQFPERGTVGWLAIPILRDQRWSAGFSIDHAEARLWRDEEVSFARIASEQAWDAAERARAANQRQSSRERLDIALSASGVVGTWDWNIPSDMVYSDARFAELFSVDPQRAAHGAPLAEFVAAMHPDDREEVSRKIAESVENCGTYAAEYRVVRRDGTIRWVFATGRCHASAQGKAVRLAGAVVDVTHRKQMQLEMEKQWQIFDAVLSNSPDFAYSFDLEGNFTYSNHGLLALLGRTLPEVVGKNFLELEYPPELAEKLMRQIEQVIQTKSPVRDETPFTSPTGKFGNYEYILVPVIGKQGEVEAVAGTTRDITERALGEQLVREDRRRWRELLLQAPAPIVLFRGPEFRYEWVNRAYEALVDRKAEVLIGKTLLEALPDAQRERFLTLLKEVYNSGTPYVGMETPLQREIHGTVTEAYVNFVYLPMRNTSGEIDGIFVHITDVTDLVQSRKRVEASEQRFRQLADSMPHIVWTAGVDGLVDYCNERWYQFTGFDRKTDFNSGWESLLHPEDRPRAHKAWSASVASGDTYQIDYRLWDVHNQSWRWFTARGVPVLDAKGAVSKWFGTCTDIQDYWNSQQALLQTHKRESLGIMAAGIAHDFNNLLVGIMGGASFALDALESSHPAYAMLRNVIASSERAAHLTRQMLAYAGKGRFVIELLDVNAMVEQSLQLLGAAIPKSVQVKMELADALPAVESDAGQLDSIVMNLIINAAEAGSEDSGVVAVRTRVEEILRGTARRGIDGEVIAPGSYVVLEVQDTGAGIDPANMAKICDPFFTTKFTGRGLGLAAVSGIVRAHRGAIEVASIVGRGTTFRIYLPAAAQRAGSVVAPTKESSAPGREKILIIDDEPMVRKVAQAALAKSGYTAIIADSGNKGLELAHRDRDISLVLLDMSMPGVSGRQVLEALNKVRPSLPVIICSGYSEDEVYGKFAGLEFTGFLQKPFTVHQLSSRVRAALDGELPSEARA